MIVQVSDDRRHRAEFQRGVINVGGGDIDDLKKLGHKLKTVFGDVEKVLVFGNLIHGMLSEGDGMGGGKGGGETKTNLQ